jgi:hypothetical protein
MYYVYEIHNWCWRVSSSGIWCRVVCWVATDVSEEHNASIFRVEKIISARMSVATRITRLHIPEDDTLHNHRCGYLHNWCSSPNMIRMIMLRRMRWVWHTAYMGRREIEYRILVGKPKWKKALRRYRSRWEDNIKMDLREVWWGDMDWIYLAQDRDQWRALVNTVTNLRAT